MRSAARIVRHIDSAPKGPHDCGSLCHHNQCIRAVHHLTWGMPALSDRVRKGATTVLIGPAKLTISGRSGILE